jgi:hypothetical protein
VSLTSAAREPDVTDPKLFVIARRCGRLANRLMLFAHFISFAEERRHRVINFTFHSYADLFDATCRDIYCGYPVIGRRSWLDIVPGIGDAIRKTRLLYHVTRAAAVLNGRFPMFGRRVVTLREIPRAAVTPLDSHEVQEQICDARIIFAYGWRFRASHLVQRHAEKIRAYFRPTEFHSCLAEQVLAPLRRDADVVIGVHIRQGDYRRWKGGRCFFPISRYAGWMHELAEQFPSERVTFLVCSDEPRQTQEFPGLSVGFGPGSPFGDILGLAKCDYILGPLSTFSQWASFYGNKPLFLLRALDDRAERDKFRVSYLDA